LVGVIYRRAIIYVISDQVAIIIGIGFISDTIAV